MLQAGEATQAPPTRINLHHTTDESLTCNGNYTQMPRKPPTKTKEDQDQWEVTEGLIYSLAKQPLTVAPHRSTLVDTLILKCRHYVNERVAPMNGPNTGGRPRTNVNLRRTSHSQ